jgi:hypothetical protein
MSFFNRCTSSMSNALRLCPQDPVDCQAKSMLGGLIGFYVNPMLRISLKVSLSSTQSFASCWIYRQGRHCNSPGAPCYSSLHCNSRPSRSITGYLPRLICRACARASATGYPLCKMRYAAQRWLARHPLVQCSSALPLS